MRSEVADVTGIVKYIVKVFFSTKTWGSSAPPNNFFSGGGHSLLPPPPPTPPPKLSSAIMLSTALEQKCLDLRLLSPALPNRWLLLVTSYYHVAVLTSECPIKREKKIALSAAYPVNYLKYVNLFDTIVYDQLYNFLTNEDVISTHH